MKLSCSPRLFALALGAFVLLIGVDHACASGGIFGSDIGLQSNNFNSGNTTFFEADLLGDSRHAPVASSSVTLPVTLDPRGFNGLNLGTFNPSAGDTLSLVGGETLTYKNSGTNISVSTLNYSIDNGSFTSVNLPFNEDNVNGNTGDQRWALTNNMANILANPGVGTHTLSFYTTVTANDGSNYYTLYDSNNGSNFTASFTVVPEPSTWAGALLLVLTTSAVLLRRFGLRLPG